VHSLTSDTVDHDILTDRLQQSFCVKGWALSWIKSFLWNQTQSVSIEGMQSTRLPLTCGVTQGSLFGPILFLVKCADVIAIAQRHGLGVHSYADDTQLYFHADPSAVDSNVQKLVTSVGDIDRWMCANRLKLNQDKTQFLWLGTLHQLSKLRLLTITLGGINIKMSTEAMCLGVLLDSAITFVAHV